MDAQQKKSVWLVKFELSPDLTMYAAMGIADEEVIREFNIARLIECELTNDRVNDLKNYSNVLYIEKDIPVYAYQQEVPYGSTKVQAQETRLEGYTGSGLLWLRAAVEQ